MMGKVKVFSDVHGSGPFFQFHYEKLYYMSSYPVNTFNGNCYFGDTAGDRIFTKFHLQAVHIIKFS